MRALVYRGGGEVRLEEVSYLSVPREHVLLKVKAFGVGDYDMAVYAEKLKPSKIPIVLGREFVGVIEEVGGGVKRDVIGLRATAVPVIGCGSCDKCRRGLSVGCPSVRIIGLDVDGGMADRVVVPYENVLPLPFDLRVEEGVLVEPISRILRTFERIGFLADKVLVLLGSTSTNVLASRIARAFGARVLLVSDANVEGVEIVGPADCVDYVKAITDGEGADVVVPGSEELIELAPEVVRPGGILAMISPLAEAPVERLILREVSVITTRAAPMGLMKRAVDLLRSGKVQVEDLLKYGEFSPDVFRMAAAYKWLKIVVTL